MDRSNHYEAAFEAYLRQRKLCYVPVDESKRTSLEDEPIKSLDFVVQPNPQTRLLVDIKGRRFPGGKPERPNYAWQTWCTREDVDGLRKWAHQFGAGSSGLIVFAYDLSPLVDIPLGVDDLWIWKGRRYLIRAVEVEAYRQAMRVRSPKWDTVHLKGSDFRELVRPFCDWLGTGC